VNGYAGKLLFVDLSDRSMREEALSEEMAREFIGGYGIGARVLYSMMKPGVDPLGPEAVVGFVTGPATATGASFGGRYTVVCKSPASGTWNDANSGGFFGPELKRAGFDAVFVSGASETPVYLWIHDGEVEIRDASTFWGLDAKETQAALEKQTGDARVRAAVIGPSGERLSLISAVMNDGHRAAGRGGSGAVMGSKKLKAIAVRGTGTIPTADPERFKELNSAVRAGMKGNPMADLFGGGGTGATTAGSALSGDSPVKNWGGVGVVDYTSDEAAALGSGALDKYKTKKYACAQCPLGCGAEYEVTDGPWPLGKTDRPEYEAEAAFGTLCGNKSAEAMMKCNDICNRSGLDVISAGATIAWAIECYENGVLDSKDTGGIELKWGNAEAMVAATQAMADATGFGTVLALGSKGAADKLGKGFEYVQSAHGIELAMHDPRMFPGLARTYQYDPTPGRHVKGGTGLSSSGPDRFETEGSGPADMQAVAFTEMMNSAGFCLLMGYVGGAEQIFPLVAAATGFDMQDLQSASMRIAAMRQAFNVREGLARKDFNVPDRAVGKPPQEVGPNAGATVDNEGFGDNFFAAMGWDPATGKPSRETLVALGGMDDVVADLYA